MPLGYTSFQAALHSGLRIRYGLRALRQAPRLPLSHFAHQSALLDYCGLATLNGLARNGRSLRSTPRKIRSSSLAKLTLSLLDLRFPPVLATLATAVIDSYAFGLAQRKPLGFTPAYAFHFVERGKHA